MKHTNKVVITLAIWFVLTMAILTWGLNLISEADTAFNILGLGILISWALISYNTSCLTNISIKFKKDKK